MTHILVVEDEPPILRALVLNLSHRGYDVTSAGTGSQGLEMARNRPPDLLLLDLGLPDLDGLEVIRRMRTLLPTLPVIVLSARTTSNDKAMALDLGAVDYVTKPFDMNELVTRLQAAARRFEISAEPTVVAIGDACVDLTAHVATAPRDVGARAIRFTPTEWRMLEVLLRRPGSLVTSLELDRALRSETGSGGSSYLRDGMAGLRRKLEPVPSRPRYLLTEPGVGYRFRP